MLDFSRRVLLCLSHIIGIGTLWILFRISRAWREEKNFNKMKPTRPLWYDSRKWILLVCSDEMQFQRKLVQFIKYCTRGIRNQFYFVFLQLTEFVRQHCFMWPLYVTSDDFWRIIRYLINSGHIVWSPFPWLITIIQSISARKLLGACSSFIETCLIILYLLYDRIKTYYHHRHLAPISNNKFENPMQNLLLTLRHLNDVTLLSVN